MTRSEENEFHLNYTADLLRRVAPANKDFVAVATFLEQLANVYKKKAETEHVKEGVN
jgi:hypothetical protein